MIENVPHRWIVIAVAALGITVVATAGALMTEVGPWYERLRSPWFRPPNWAFGPAWGIIFLFIGSSAVLAWERAPDDAARGWVIGLFVLNGALNVLWSALFFKLRRPDWALIEVVALWLSILALVLYFATFSPIAAILISVYLFWVAFAALLNLRIVQLNAPFGADR